MHLNDVWNVENFRFSFFIDPAAREHWFGMWQAIAGKEPDSRTDKAGGLHRIEEGVWQGHNLTITTFPDRIDFVWAASASEFEIAQIGKLGEILPSFSASILAYFKDEHLKSVRRLGFATTLLQPVSDQRAGYELLAFYLPSVKIDPNSSDFYYQINRRIASSSNPIIQINRINRWAVIAAALVSLALGTPSVTRPFIAGRLEVDINNAEESLFGPDNLFTLAVLEEFFEIAKDLATNGDQP